MITPQNLAAASAMDGFKNYKSSSFSVSVPSQNLGPGSFITYTASTPLNNSNSISQVQLQYSGLTNNYLVMNGSVNTYWNSSWQSVGPSGSYIAEIESYYYFDSNNLYVYTVIVNQTGGTITIPAITINCRGFLFLAPF